MSENEKSDAVPAPRFNVAPSPHLSDPAITTRRVMRDVLIGLVPLFGWAFHQFGWLAVKQVAICVISCLVFEALFTILRGRRPSLGDCSAAITGAILGLSLPAAAPWYIGVIGSMVGIGIGKVVFGGLGQNLFNPAMVGRAFVMLSFAGAMGAPAYIVEKTDIPALTQATPLTVAKKIGEQLSAGLPVSGTLCGLDDLFIGYTNGSLGEVSALCILIGGLYLIARKAAAWQIPAGSVVGLIGCAGAAHLLGLTPFCGLQHLLSGAFLFGAFFIATDPVSSPLSRSGRFYFGLGYGVFVVILRVFSSYPEGVMFAVLIMNAIVPLINRFTVPVPIGGIGPAPKKA